MAVKGSGVRKRNDKSRYVTTYDELGGFFVDPTFLQLRSELVQNAGLNTEVIRIPEVTSLTLGDMLSRLTLPFDVNREYISQPFEQIIVKGAVNIGRDATRNLVERLQSRDLVPHFEESIFYDPTSETNPKHKSDFLDDLFKSLPEQLLIDLLQSPLLSSQTVAAEVLKYLHDMPGYNVGPKLKTLEQRLLGGKRSLKHKTGFRLPYTTEEFPYEAVFFKDTHPGIFALMGRRKRVHRLAGKYARRIVDIEEVIADLAIDSNRFKKRVTLAKKYKGKTGHDKSIYLRHKHYLPDQIKGRSFEVNEGYETPKEMCIRQLKDTILNDIFGVMIITYTPDEALKLVRAIVPISGSLNTIYNLQSQRYQTPIGSKLGDDFEVTEIDNHFAKDRPSNTLQIKLRYTGGAMPVDIEIAIQDLASAVSNQIDPIWGHDVYERDSENALQRRLEASSRRYPLEARYNQLRGYISSLFKGIKSEPILVKP